MDLSRLSRNEKLAPPSSEPTEAAGAPSPPGRDDEPGSDEAR